MSPLQKGHRVGESPTRTRSWVRSLTASSDRAARLDELPVDLLDLRLLRRPERRIAERAELLDRLPLLLDPREVLLVVPPLPHRAAPLLNPVRRRVVEAS